jgi:hypothetical protein
MISTGPEVKSRAVCRWALSFSSALRSSSGRGPVIAAELRIGSVKESPSRRRNWTYAPPMNPSGSRPVTTTPSTVGTACPDSIRTRRKEASCCSVVRSFSSRTSGETLAGKYVRWKRSRSRSANAAAVIRRSSKGRSFDRLFSSQPPLFFRRCDHPQRANSNAQAAPTSHLQRVRWLHHMNSTPGALWFDKSLAKAQIASLVPIGDRLLPTGPVGPEIGEKRFQLSISHLLVGRFISSVSYSAKTAPLRSRLGSGSPGGGSARVRENLGLFENLQPLSNPPRRTRLSRRCRMRGRCFWCGRGRGPRILPGRVCCGGGSRVFCGRGRVGGR